jgi:hypothetical protein
VFTSPFPPAECSRRLAAVTVPRPTGGQLRLLIAGGPRPTLVGEVSPSRVRVALPPSRGSLETWFEGVMNPVRQGGTIVRGAAGPASSSLVPARVVSVMLAVVVVIMTASGVASTISGSGPGPAMLVVPGFLTAFYVFIWAITSWQTRLQTEFLVGKLSEILESTAT